MTTSAEPSTISPSAAPRVAGNKGWLRRIDRQLLFVLALAALLVIPRTLLIAHAHTETVDEEYHLYFGLRGLHLDLDRAKLNDPPTGEALVALPYRLLGLPPIQGSVMHGRAVSVETLMLLVALWKAMLFVPFVGVVFVWVRRVFGLAGGWLAAGLICFDPNFAGHLAPAALDVIGVEGIVIATFAWWRYFERQTITRLILASMLLTFALTLKHTAIILPGIVVLIGACFWIGRRHEQRAIRQLRHSAIAIVVGLAALTLFSGGVRQPAISKPWRQDHPKMGDLIDRKLPAGWYIGSLTHAIHHGDRGHRSFLLGERGRHGWWSYFPIVATYKVPIPHFVLGGIALASFFWRRPRFEEIGLVLPAAAFGVFIAQSGINIGFRHILPAYAFVLMWIGGRSMVLPPRGRWLSLAIAAIGAIHVISWHPNYLSYLNWPRQRVWTQINDSNLDWGQALKQVRRWIDRRPNDGRPIYISYFGKTPHAYYLGDRVTYLPSTGPLPSSGLLIIGPTQLMHVYDDEKTYRPLQKRDPIVVIGGSMPVFDLDALAASRRSTNAAAAAAGQPNKDR